jgi:hypothetical protein
MPETMFKRAMRDGEITVNNPSIWRPIISIEDAASAYIRAIEANAYGMSKLQGEQAAMNLADSEFSVGTRKTNSTTKTAQSLALIHKAHDIVCRNGGCSSA